MNDISIYFKPSEEEFEVLPDSLASKIEVHTQDSFPHIESGDIAIFEVPEYRNSDYSGSKKSNYKSFFNELFPGANWKRSIADLGVVLPGETIEDTYYAVANVISELVKMDVIPIVIGGSQDLTYAMYKGYEKLEQTINITTVDHKLDLGSPDESMNSEGWLSHIVLHKPCYLFNYSNIGCQSHFVKATDMDLFDKLYFDVNRVGQYLGDKKIAEPILRNTDILSLDLGAIKASEMDGVNYTSPNGFGGQDICQIARYAGVSDKLSSFGVFNLFPDGMNQFSAHLIAQTIWYFIDGVQNRKGDFPKCSKVNYTKFRVHTERLEQEIIFYKSDKSERWWMEVPYPAKPNSQFERHHLVPCTYGDYKEAMKNELPDLWWKTFQKLG